MKKLWIVISLFLATTAYGDTPAPGAVFVKGGTSSNKISDTAGSLNVNVTGGAGMSSNIAQFGGNNVVTGTGTSGLGIPRFTVSNDSSVLVSNFPATQTIAGTVTSNQGTSPWVSNVTQFGGNPVVTGTGASGLGIPRFTVANDSSITANAGSNLNTSLLELDTTAAKLNLAQGSTTSGQTGTLIQGAVTTAAPTYTTAQTSPISLTTAGGLRTDTTTIAGTTTVTAGVAGLQAIGGNAASGASDTGNPVKVGAVFNTTLPTVTTGQRVDAQADANGRKIVTNVPLDGSKATYSAAVTALTVAATPTDIFTITGSASKTIRVTKIEFSGSETTGAIRDLLLIKRSTADTGGTSAAATAVPYDSNDAAASATVLSYTVNPTLGTTVGTVRSVKFDIPSANLASASSTVTWDFGIRPAKAAVLRGTGQVLAVNLNSVSSGGSSLNIYVEWTEE